MLLFSRVTSNFRLFIYFVLVTMRICYYGCKKKNRTFFTSFSLRFFFMIYQTSNEQNNKNNRIIRTKDLSKYLSIDQCSQSSLPFSPFFLFDFRFFNNLRKRRYSRVLHFGFRFLMYLLITIFRPPPFIFDFR